MSLESALREREETLRRLDDANAALIRHAMQLEEANRRLASQAGDLERKTAEIESAADALRVSEERFKALTEHAIDLVLIVDVDGVIGYASSSVERILGMPAPELVGRSLFDVLHPQDAELARPAHERSVQERHGHSEMELRFAHADGDWRTMVVRSTGLLDVPAVGGIVLNAHDVTERRALEAQLRQSQKMEAIGRLTAGIAHDFNNLLTAISGYATFAMEEASRDEVRADLREVVTSANRASALTRQLLAFSRQQVLRPRLLDLNSVVRNLLPLIRRSMGEDVHLDTRLADVLEPILADPIQIEQVLLNLAVNARDAMPHGGTLSIETRVVDSLLDGPDAPPRRCVSMAVADTGEGMPPEVRERIFEPFFTTKESGRGTGLGLSTVYGIVRQSGGAISVYSEIAEGTVFKVLLPVADPAQAGGAAVRSSPTREAGIEVPRGDGRSILLVEDDPSVRAFASRGLEQLGYRVVAAETGEDALGLLHGREPLDALVTDVIMPRVSGSVLAEVARTERPGFPVLFISGYTYNQILDRGVLPADVHFLEKPFTIPALGRALAALLDRNETPPK